MAEEATREILLGKFKAMQERIDALEKADNEKSELIAALSARVDALEKNATNSGNQTPQSTGESSAPKPRKGSSASLGPLPEKSPKKQAEAPAGRRASMVHLHRAALEARLSAGVQAPMTSSERIASLGIDDFGRERGNSLVDEAKKKYEKK